MQKMKRLCAAFAALFISITMINGIGQAEVRAASMETKSGVADFERGSSSIVIQGNEGQTLIGKKFNIYKLFNAQNAKDNESINYTFNAPFENALKTIVGRKISKDAKDVTEYEVIDYIQSLNKNPIEGAQAVQKKEGSYSDFRYFIEALRTEIVREKAFGDEVKVNNVRYDNSIQIKGLDYGYYIVDEVSMIQGENQAASLCMVNTLNPTGTVNIKSDYPAVSKKIQEDDNKTIIGENGWNDIADFEIGQTVPYKFTSFIPDINGYDDYYYAWHDIMNPALTFRENSVSVTIRNANEGEYTLAKDEFMVIVNPGQGETFKVEVADIKAIVDREFNRMNANGENIYGQEVILRYDAVLNDNAALDTGRPGFENDVKLEFSNNPDADGKGSTGETPWDTVVCFTYKLNGLKLNNHNKELEDARFRLFSDEKCGNEVYVKKNSKGYVVINRDSAGGKDHTGGTVPTDSVEIVSGTDGIFTIYGLDGGTYWLKETKAPSGYRPILDPIRVEVSPTFVENRNNYIKGDGVTDKALKRLEFVSYIKQFLSGIFEEDTILLSSDIIEGAGNLTVVNQVGNKLPVTGSYYMIPIFALGAGLIMLAAGKKWRK